MLNETPFGVPTLSKVPLQVGMLPYPGLTLLDLIGPQTALDIDAHIHLVAGSLAPIESDTGVATRPTATCASCPRDLDVLFVPGGFGLDAAMAYDPEPPVDACSPEFAGAASTERAMRWMGGAVEHTWLAVAAAATRVAAPARTC